MKVLLLGVSWFVLWMSVSAESLPDQPVKVDMAKLVEIVDKYAIPKPPKKAQLYFAATGSWTVLGNRSTDHDPSIYNAGLLLDPSDTNQLEKADMMIGFSYVSVTRNDFYSPAIRKFTATPAKPQPKGYYFSASDASNVATAIQCARIGLHDEAASLIRLFQKEDYARGFKTQEQYGPYLTDYELFTARMIFEYYYTETLGRDADLKLCLAQLTKLQKEFPMLFNFEKLGHFAQRRVTFISDLKTTVETPDPAEGSIERLVIAYADLDHNTLEKSELEMQIYLKGVAAISELIRLFDDNRLTKVMNPGIMNQASSISRLKYAARHLLENMTNVSFKNKASWNAWLKRQDLANEKAFFMKMAHPINQGKAYHVIPVKILMRKYPDSSEGIITEISQLQNDGLHQYAREIMANRLADDKKLNLLRKLYNNQNGLKKRYMLQTMAQLDESAVLNELQSLIETIPLDVDTPYWTAEEAHLTHVVAQVSDLATWRKYYQKTKSCKVGLRMEMMNCLNYSYLKDKNRSLRIAFLAAFLDDSEVRLRTDSKRWDGPHAGFRYERISVQNYVADKLNSMLKLKENPTEFWKEEQWEKLRQRIKQKLATMQLPEMR